MNLKEVVAYPSLDTLNFEKLTEFDPALIYGFESQAGITKRSNDPSSFEHLMGLRQHQDLLDGYLYAQGVILPELRSRPISDIKAEEILAWLDQMHLRMARTLAQNVKDAGIKDVKAGESSKRCITRWRYGRGCRRFLGMYLSGELSKNDLFTELKKLNVDMTQIQAFINLLIKIRDDKTIQPPACELPYIKRKDPLFKENLAFLKLANCYNSGKLTLHEKVVIESIVKICALPEELPKKRMQFANALLSKLKEIDPSNLEQVVELAEFTFHTLTEDHSYFDANGRVATGFMNVILRFFKEPSILIRNPGEKNDPNSTYSQIFSQADPNRLLLKQHIQQRVLNARENKQYKDDQLERITKLRIVIVNILTSIRDYLPELDLDKFFPMLARQLGENLKFVEQVTPDHMEDGYKFYIQSTLTEVRSQLVKKYNLNNKDITSLGKGLRTAAANDKIEDINFFLILGCNINQQDDNKNNQKTPLHWAVINGHSKAAKFLIDKGAKFDIRDAFRKTALDYAKEKADPEVLALFRDNEAEVKSDLATQQSSF